MKKSIISLIALAAVSTVALASEYHGESRDSDTYIGRYSSQVMDQSVSLSALAIIKSDDGRSLTSYERMIKNSKENETSGN